MPRCWRLARVLSAASALAGSAASPAAAGQLALDDPAEPPALGLDTSAAQRVRRLLEEIEQLRAMAPAGEDERRREVRLAGINLRRVAAFLLEQGDAAGPSGSPAIIAGVCLAAGRGDIDTLSVGGADTPGAAAVLDALRRFNSLSASFPGLDVSDPARLDELLAAVLRPLAEAVERTAGASTVNHWIALDQAGSPDPGAALDRLAAQAETAGLDEAGRAELARITDFLRRGAAFDEFRAQVVACADVVERALRLAEALRDAPWMSPAQREQVRRALGDALRAFGSPPTRERGREQLESLASAAAIAARISALGAPSPGGPRRGAAARDPGPIAAAFGAALADATPRGAAAAARLGAVIDRMSAYRALGEVPLPYDLQPVWRSLHEDYGRAEAALLEALPRFTAPGGASDPALVSLADAQRDDLDALRSLRSIHDWTASLREMSPRAAGPAAARLRRLLAALGEPAGRTAAERALGDLEERLRTCVPMPFEAELRRGDPAAVLAAGARQADVVEAIDAARRDWAEAWAEGGGQPQARRLDLLLALARAMEQSAGLLTADDRAAGINRWSAWEIDPAVLARIVSDVRGRLRLAAAAAADGDEAALAGQVGRIDVAPVGLMSRLAGRLDAPLAALPAGALGTMGQSVHAPGPGAWMHRSRTALADFCRYAMEQDFARSSGRPAVAEGLGKYLDGLAGRLERGIAP